MTILRGLLALIITIVIAVVAVLNRDVVPVHLNPLDSELSYEFPLYILVLGAAVFGFIVGGLMVWINMSSLRRQKRQQKKDLKKLEKEVTKLKDDKFKPREEQASVLPALIS